MATITRTPMVDDDGSGTTGTVINNAWKTELYNQIDAVVGAAPGIVEAAFTPADGSGAGLTFPTAKGIYVKVGTLVAAFYEVVFPTTANGSLVGITLPVASKTGSVVNFTGAMAYTDYATPIMVYVQQGTTLGFSAASGTLVSNAQASAKSFRFAAFYVAA